MHPKHNQPTYQIWLDLSLHNNTVNLITLVQNTDDLQDELSSFRQQWQEELEQNSRSNSPQLQQETSSNENVGEQQKQSLKPADTDESIESRVGIT